MRDNGREYADRDLAFAIADEKRVQTCDRCDGSGVFYVCEDGSACDVEGCSRICSACAGEGTAPTPGGAA